MEEFTKAWLLNPTIGKLLTAGIAVIVVFAIVRYVQRSIASRQLPAQAGF